MIVNKLFSADVIFETVVALVHCQCCPCRAHVVRLGWWLQHTILSERGAAGYHGAGGRVVHVCNVSNPCSSAFVIGILSTNSIMYTTVMCVWSAFVLGWDCFDPREDVYIVYVQYRLNWLIPHCIFRQSFYH